MKRAVLVLACLLMVVCVPLQPAKATLPARTHVVNNLEDYLVIDKYSFTSGTDVTAFATVKNVGQQAIEAYSLGFVFFDYFNEKCEAFSGYSSTRVAPGRTESGSWKRSYVSGSPLTGFVWVQAIRLSDDTVLLANTDEVAGRISEVIQAPVSPEDMTLK